MMSTAPIIRTARRAVNAEIASHLKNQISLEDYIKIFETIWQARAKAAGWTLTIDGQGRKIYFRFSR